MRKELFGIGDYVHVYNRGNKKQDIVKDERDRQHFLEMLFYFNTEVTPPNPFQNIKTSGQLLRLSLNSWPEHWAPRKPLVNILNFILMKNHFHLLLEEISENGISKFMQRLGTGMTMYYNNRHKETGMLFQGPYKAKVINEDIYLKYLNVYIHIKNGFELYKGGFKVAMKEFDKAYEWITKFPFGSLSHYYGGVNSSIVDKNLFLKIFPSAYDYKNFAKDCIETLEGKLVDLTIEV